VRYQPISPQRLTETLAAAIAARAVDGVAPEVGRSWVRVGLDGPAALGPERLAAELVAPLRERGVPALAVPLDGFVRPASVRLEQGRTNPDAYYENWFDLAAVRREVLDPLGAGGTGRVLPSRWDVRTDRATRAEYVDLPPGGALLLGGPLLLGAGLPLDLAAHLLVTPAALARLTPPEEQWTLAAYERYAAEVAPETLADVVIRYDDPAHPAIRLAG
jgi:hypothetical protein